jgi:hypothetical protein
VPVLGLRQFARELCAARQAGPAPPGPKWRPLSPSAELMVDPECHARCAIRDTRARGANRFHWSVTVLGRDYPIVAGRTGELAEARSLGEMALGAYAAEWSEVATARCSGDD